MTLEDLKDKLKGKILILGIGNTLKADDAIGSLLAKGLKNKIRAEVIDAQTSPENFLGKIQEKNPDTLIIIDAADFGGKPGEVKAFRPEEISTVNLFSTHNSSISLIAEFFKSSLKAQILFLAIQPKKVIFKEGLSEELVSAKNKVENFFQENLPL